MLSLQTFKTRSCKLFHHYFASMVKQGVLTNMRFLIINKLYCGVLYKRVAHTKFNILNLKSFVHRNEIIRNLPSSMKFLVIHYFLITFYFILLLPCPSWSNCLRDAKHLYNSCSTKAVNRAIPNWWRLRYRQALEEQLLICSQMANIHYNRCLNASILHTRSRFS